MTGTLTRAGRALASIVTLPPAIAHEATHAVAALPWAERVGVVIEPTDLDAAVGVDWREDAPGWASWVVGYAPLVLGLCVGVAALWRIVTEGVPAGTDLAYAAILGCWWAIYAWPSADDRRSARGQGRDTEES